MYLITLTFMLSQLLIFSYLLAYLLGTDFERNLDRLGSNLDENVQNWGSIWVEFERAQVLLLFTYIITYLVMLLTLLHTYLFITIFLTKLPISTYVIIYIYTYLILIMLTYLLIT